MSSEAKNAASPFQEPIEKHCQVSRTFRARSANGTRRFPIVPWFCTTLRTKELGPAETSSLSAVRSVWVTLAF